MSIPQFYLHERKRGGGMIQPTTTDGVLTAMIAARGAAIANLKKCNEDIEDSCLLQKLNQMIVAVSEVAVVDKAMQEDADKGLVPFFVVATLGTPSVFSCDHLAEIGPVCCRYCAWLHVDASYGGAAFLCPEFRPLMSGIEYSSSFTTSPHQWLLTHHDCSILYVKEKKKFLKSLTIDHPYLKLKKIDEDFNNWTIPLTRRFRSIKLWFVMRDNGIEGLQAYIWNHCLLAKCFEELINKDTRFKVVYEVWFGIVCFRLCGSDELNKNLLKSINSSQEIFLTSTTAKGQYIIQFSVSYQCATEEDICTAWKIIQKHATKVLQGDDTCTKKPTTKPPPEKQNSKQLCTTHKN
ncbi:hypothetical protein L9F63_003045 [Diploptera punctata]|uniref:Aromatic-L-amino-acid decarboxylase n=1 Tax=Diploptera punctata TaxID=6984 RepID=A0AAD7ZQS6_DIPPU|nr:hypothetical protein L9F63_003045 [Diploptera punctata]